MFSTENVMHGTYKSNISVKQSRTCCEDKDIFDVICARKETFYVSNRENHTITTFLLIKKLTRLEEKLKSKHVYLCELLM